MSILLFAALALVALLGAVGVIASRNPVHSALFLLVNFATFAIFYFLLNAQFLGVVQVIVYAGAIVVLFLFVVMLIGGSVSARQTRTRRIMSVAAIVLAALFLLAVVIGIASNAPAQVAVGAPGSGSVQAIGAELYTVYITPFELASILLLAGMLGGVVLARRYIPHTDE
ncbi:MAG: NADH-quinone oxidoreductase subunit J [Caldilineales bacterium]|nr:NADH-quinone oxidoreductase subunit J [Caldilineales bacterium]